MDSGTKKILAGLAALMVIGVVAQTQKSDPPRPRPKPAAPVDVPTRAACKPVVYYVWGTADSVDLTIRNGQGNIEQASGVAVPLEVDGEPGFPIGCLDPGEFVSISAQNNGRTGTVKCVIEADDETISTATSDGAYVVASCSETVP